MPLMQTRYCRILAALPLFLFLPVLVTAETPQLIPQPREVKAKAEGFRVSSDLQIVLLSSAPDEDRLAAECLQEERRSVTGQTYPIGRRRAATSKTAIYLGRLDQEAMQAMLAVRGIESDGIGAQGYVLDLAPNRIFIAGKDSDGLFYGVQTLCQLVVGDGPDTSVLGVRVRDWPALRYRGTQVDLSRGPVPRLATQHSATLRSPELSMAGEDCRLQTGSP